MNFPNAAHFLLLISLFCSVSEPFHTGRLWQVAIVNLLRHFQVFIMFTAKCCEGGSIRAKGLCSAEADWTLPPVHRAMTNENLWHASPTHPGCLLMKQMSVCLNAKLLGFFLPLGCISNTWISAWARVSSVLPHNIWLCCMTIPFFGSSRIQRVVLKDKIKCWGNWVSFFASAFHLIYNYSTRKAIRK